MSSCVSWDSFLFFFLFLVFLGCVLFSSTAYGFLIFLMVRYKQLLWQPQYILLKNISACSFGMTLFTALVVLSSVLQTQIYGYWCITQFCMLRCFFLVSQITLALMAVERYIFICHGIHYLRIITTHNVHMTILLIWLVSGAVSLHGGLVLSQIQCGFQQQTSGLLCDAVTIKEHITFSQEENMLVFGPPSVITTFCILTICYCYGCMYHAALRVTMTLKCSNHRANRTVGFYFLMFLLQLGLNIFFVTLTVMGQRKASTCKTIRSIVTPTLIILPTCIIAAFFIVRNPQIKRLLFPAWHQKCRSTIRAEVEMFQQSRSGDEMGDHTRHFDVDPNNMMVLPPPLPGYVSPSCSGDC